MASFTLYVDTYINDDGKRKVRIRVYHNHSNTSVSTPYLVDKTQVTKGGKIKDAAIVDACNQLIASWHSVIARLGNAVQYMNAKELVSLLKEDAGNSALFDFIAYMHKVAETKRARQTISNYHTVATSLSNFMRGVPLDINTITAKKLSAYEEWLRGIGKTQNTIIQYMTIVKATYNKAIYEYNDEDSGELVVVRQPFRKYKMPSAPAPSVRGIELATLQAIADLPTEPRFSSQRNIGRDLFMLSFALGGMNLVDIYHLPCDALKGDYIEYKRQKTRGARADEALYRVYICPEVRPLLERWFDTTRKKLFMFHRLFKWENAGAKMTQLMGKVESAAPNGRHYTFYAARHTYASLARNAVGLDKYTVHELLNHSDSEMKITDRYIERDWQRLFDAHAKVVRLVDWTTLNKS